MVSVNFLLFLDVFGQEILSAGTENVDEVLLHVPVADGDVAHHIVAVTRRIPCVSVTPCEPLASHLPAGASPDLEGGVDSDQQPWDSASTPDLEALAHTGIAGRGNPPSLLFSAKPASICPDRSTSAVSDGCDVEVRSPEVIRGEPANGSLVPAYGSTGKFCFLLLLFLTLISS